VHNTPSIGTLWLYRVMYRKTVVFDYTQGGIGGSGKVAPGRWESGLEMVSGFFSYEGGTGGVARLRLKDSPLAFLRRFQSDFFR